MGARRADIRMQFLVEAAVLCLAGGVAGLGLGVVLGTLLSHFVMRHVAMVPPWALGAALLVPALTGLGFGLYPAAKAAKLDPIEALRTEN